MQEGMSKEAAAPSGAPPGFEEMMEANSKNVQLKGARPKTPPGEAPKS